MDLKTKDVAELLDVSETTVRRWLVEGKIPAYRINQQFRFSRSEIETWLLNQRNNRVYSSDEEMDKHQGSLGSKQFSLYRAIHRGQILYDMPGETSEEVIRHTMKTVAKKMNLDAEVITELLLDRERLQPTALGDGIGIPHTRDFLLSSHHDVVNVVFPSKSLSYGALDGKPVHTLFFLFSSDDKRHLHLLAKIAHLSSQPKTLSMLKSRPNKAHLLEFIKTWESNLRAPLS